MHPEIVSDHPGRCPKCYMDLVLVETKAVPTSSIHHGSDRGLGKITWKSYIPLIVIVLMILVSSLITSSGTTFSVTTFAIHFMTGFFLVFGGFKLLDLKGFAEGYSTYDLLAGKVKIYGYIYPFIEIAFGFLMLAGYHSSALLWTEFVVMVFSGIGVSIKIAKGEEFQCACLGTSLKVPLTYVTLIEDFGMALLALFLIILNGTV